MFPHPPSAEKAFLEAMVAKYSSNSPSGGSVPGLPGTIANHFESGRYRIIDFYTAPCTSLRVAGQTVIYFGDEPIWSMHYGGTWNPKAIPFLRACLLSAYREESRFYGGRGYPLILGDGMKYQNSINRSHFTRFDGSDQIVNDQGELLGYSWYQGMYLLDRE